MGMTNEIRCIGVSVCSNNGKTNDKFRNISTWPRSAHDVIQLQSEGKLSTLLYTSAITLNFDLR